MVFKHTQLNSKIVDTRNINHIKKSTAEACLTTYGKMRCCKLSGAFYQHRLILIPAWLSNHMSTTVWTEITYPFRNFNGVIVEILVMDKYIHPMIGINVIAHPTGIKVNSLLVKVVTGGGSVLTKLC